MLPTRRFLSWRWIVLFCLLPLQGTCPLLAEDETWVATESEWSRPAASLDDPVVKRDAHRLWSLAPLTSVQVPNASEASPIDGFLARAHASHGLHPAKPVERRRLIRRLYHDLLGLPPTQVDVDSFVTDPHPDAYERLVDQVLADPRGGERQATLWLDLVRFAESHGFEHDYDRPHAYHYRDAVIRSYQRDQRFDEFVQWQVAGDLLEPADPEAWLATGFLAAGPHSTQITRQEAERHRYDHLDDMIGTIGTAFLGLTIQCARCHDHPYDPLSQRDYYGLIAHLSRTVRAEAELALDPARDVDRIIEHERRGQPFRDALFAYEQKVLPQRLKEWLRWIPPTVTTPAWLLPDEVVMSTAGERAFTTGDEGVMAVRLDDMPSPIWVVEITSHLPVIRAVRIELLTDPDMVHGGPGLGDEGNFVLEEVKAAWRPLVESTPAPWVPLPLTQPRATFAQRNGEIALTVDGRSETAWGIDPQYGRPHAASWTFPSEGLSPEKGSATALRLEFHFGDHLRPGWGRFRISLAESEPTALETTAPLPESVVLALRRPPSSWLEKESASVLRWFRTQDTHWQELEHRCREHEHQTPRPTLSKVLVATEGLPPLILHTQADREFSETVYVLQRGDPKLKLEPVTPAFPPGLAPVLLEHEAVRLDVPTRLRLAKWLVDVEHGVGALVARVIVNRVWQQHFGRGLVASPNDFGHRGDFPSHPELLEWLVRDFVSAGWSIKRLHRQIVLTAAYQRESDLANDMAAADPENLWLTRWTTRRLDAEVLWDSILTVSQRCDDRAFGPGSSEPVHERRAIYSTLKRTRMPRALTLFDRPEANLSTGQRLETSTAHQALWWLNDPFVDAAVLRIVDEVARSTPSPTGQIDQLFSRILQRRPTDAEVTLLTRQGAHSETTQTLREICRALLMSEEFQTFD